MAERTREDRVADAIVTAVEKITGAVAAGVGTAAQAGQATAGATAGVGGSTSQTGQSTQGAAGEIRVKDDVSASEVIESLNLHDVKDAVIANKSVVAYQNQTLQSNAKLYDVTASALGLAVLGATHNITLQQQMASDHRDQNHNQQINVDEQAWSTAQIATITAKVLAELGKTTK